ncbi:MAG: hypothetical protein F6J95_013565 [Leptolyngbya sp. SIO1E4]|nr:hypothetical protein [Leptolyngbya sp. SIO1E4]
MNKSTSTAPDWGQVVSVHRGDRWSIYRRLQELNIPCICPADGTLRVEVNHAIALVLVHSTVRQFTTSRQVSRDWLERCWETQVPCTVND